MRIACADVAPGMGTMTPEQWWHSLDSTERTRICSYRDRPLPKSLVANLVSVGLLPRLALNLGVGYAVYLPAVLRSLCDDS